MTTKSCDEINSVCAEATEEFFLRIANEPETKFGNGFVLRFDADKSEWIWHRNGFAGPASELVYMEAVRASCSMDDVTGQAVLDALNKLIVK